MVCSKCCSIKEGVELGVVNRRQWRAVHYAAFHRRLGILQVSYHGRIVLEVVDMSSFISQTCFFLIGGVVGQEKNTLWSNSHAALSGQEMKKEVG